MRDISKLYFFLIAIGIFFVSCGKDADLEPGDESSDWGELIYIDPSVEYQEIDGFGASDAWRCQFVGENWPDNKKEAIADLLFSKELKEDGSPKGIGLSMWRFYLGAGSAEQGAASGITSDWRRAECFLNEDGTYNWNKHQGQQWFLNAAKSRGVEHFLAFSISAPVFYTQNGLAYAPADGAMNIEAGRMGDYADYLVNVMAHFDEQGFPFDYLSPVNETQWDWTGNGQEGTPATNAEVANLVRQISAKLTQAGLNTQIIVSEAAELDFLYGSAGKPGRENQIDDFFSVNSANSIANLPNVLNCISGHSYFTTYPNQTLISKRQQLGAKLATAPGGLGFWQSEFSILENTSDIGGGWNRDLSINTALYVARVIHFDLTLANARSWQWWTALSQYDYKDGLIYLDNGNNGITGPDQPDAETLKYDGNYRESKLLWALGNFSRFVRPGMVRVRAGLSVPKSEDFQAEHLMLSAYKDAQTNELIMVFLNYSSSDQKVTIGNLDNGLKLNGNTLECYVTSENESLRRFEMDVNQMTIPGRSVVTAKCTIQN
ncbi:glycoside hydrolase [Mangrovibacterium lignilyticum]|uniref:glycoside hydrolase n=1 Tax=Mangrovibacterium lignilyticum TaxID=2668052 RepID=UPI0013D7EB86|nr:glycoside hydrolase [Mangrovibacterium lignilyticum]